MKLDRRLFVQSAISSATVLGCARLGLGSSFDSDIRVALIGCGIRGNNHLRSIAKHVVALCDVDQEKLESTAKKMRAETGRQLDTYIDYRKLLDAGNFDTVTIATPNHTHALIAIAAAQAGKHVYVEKPVSHNIWEGRQLVAAAQRYNRVIQSGMQSRCSPGLKQAVQFVRSGELGLIQYVLGTCYKPRHSIGKSQTALTFPAHVDKDLWLGPAEDLPCFRPKSNSLGGYNPHYDWHWDFNTGNGDLGNQGIHQVDIARWFLGEDSLPPRVFAIGGRFGYDDAGNTPNTLLTCFDYPKAPLLFDVRGLPRSSHYHNVRRQKDSMDSYRGSRIGVIVQCEKGYVLVPSYSEAIAYDSQGNETERWSGGADPHSDFFRAVSENNRDLLSADIVDGHVSSALCHVANISYLLGKPSSVSQAAEGLRANPLLSDSFERITGHLRANGIHIDAGENLTAGEWLAIDPDSETFPGNERANQLSSRKYRSPFLVPNIEQELKKG